MDCFVCKSPFGIASHNDCAEAMSTGIVRLATLAVSLLDALDAFGATVPDDPQFAADAEAARRIVREEG